MLEVPRKYCTPAGLSFRPIGFHSRGLLTLANFNFILIEHRSNEIELNRTKEAIALQIEVALNGNTVQTDVDAFTPEAASPSGMP